MVLTLLLALSPVATTSADEVDAPPERIPFNRIAGDTRIETAAAIARRHFEPGVDVAFIARAGDFPDALAGGPLAAAAAGPILLTHSETLPSATATELAHLRPGRILVLGGKAAVSDAVAHHLQRYTDGPVRRAAGSDRFATAAAIATAGYSAGVPVAYVATGIDFPDALAGGVAAAREGGPILLVTSTTVPQPTLDALQALRPRRIILLGGHAAVSNGVSSALRRLTGTPVQRLAGPDRVATAVAISRHHFPDRAREVFIATGLDFPDSLAGVPAAYQLEAPLLLVGQRVTDALAAELRRLCPSRVTILGGRNAVSAGVAAQVEHVLNDVGDVPPDDDPAGLINVWYGREQAAGRSGRPQPGANIVGGVGPKVTGLWYQLNGGSPVRLRLGPDGTRLAEAGDFNIEIPFTSLCPRSNQVVITAGDAHNKVVGRRTVLLHHHDRGHLPLPPVHQVRWGDPARIDAVAQVTDGLWELHGSTVRSIRPGYGRLIALGDATWTDYEVTVPVRVHAVAASGAAVGLVMRWTGHTVANGVTQPPSGQYPLGAVPIYNFHNSRLEIEGNSNDGGRTVASVRLPYNWRLGTTYLVRAQAKSLPDGGSRYRLKVWREAETEPGEWMLTLDQPKADDHPAGSILLFAHQVDASFGDVTVRRL